jgi:hypothetical protein
VPSSPAVVGDVVYVGSEDHDVYALNARTGAYIWSYTTGAGVGFTSPAVADGTVFVGSDDGKVYALDAATGNLVWSYQTGDMVSSSPAVVGGVVYVGSDDGKVYAFGTIPVHDVAVTNVRSDRTWVYQGRTANINVTVWNNGDFTENVTVTLYYNITARDVAGVQNVTLTSGQSDVVMFEWSTAGVAPCYTNYTLTAVAEIPVDYTPADNTLTGGKMTVRFMGDVNGDGRVDMKDIGIVAAAFGSYGPNHLYPGSPPSPRWNPDADINGDGKVNMLDVAYTAQNFGKKAP